MTNETKSEMKWLRHCAEICDDARIDAQEGLTVWDRIDLKTEFKIALYEAAKNFAAACEADEDFINLYENHKACEEDARRK